MEDEIKECCGMLTSSQFINFYFAVSNTIKIVFKIRKSIILTFLAVIWV
jgi:hypothetical protein